MWRKFFEALDRNRTWKVFRHAKAIGDIFGYFGIWAWVWYLVSTVMGIVVSYVAALPAYGKVLAGLGSLSLVSLIFFVLSLIVGTRAIDRVTQPDVAVEPTTSLKKRWSKTIIGAVPSVAAILLAAFMSNKSQNPAAPQRPDKPATHSEQRAQSKAKPDQTPPDSKTETTQKTPPVAGRKARVNQQAATTPAPAPASVAAAPAPVVYNSAPNGIANSGTIQQATVNNYGPPPPPIPTVSICLTQLPVSDGKHTLELTFDTTENITEP
jgi:hypothetical protein